jgi:hypothetical protein
MGKIQQSRRRGAVHSHRELVAVDRVDVMVSKELDQASHATWIDWSAQPEYLGRETDAPEVIAKPSDSVRRAYGNDRVTSAPQLLGQAENHHLRPSRAI